MAADSSEEESEETLMGKAMSTPPRSPPVLMHQVMSSGSVCSMASQEVEDHGDETWPEDGEPVEFSMTIIEEGPKAQHWKEEQVSPRSERLNVPWVRRRQQPKESSGTTAPPGEPQPQHRERADSDGAVPPRSRGGSGGGSPRGGSSPKGSASPKSNSPRGWGQLCSTSQKGDISPTGGRFSAWRPLPKEYRHGHVPKNLNLAEEYRNAGHASPPTTLMIRNIPNRYTQRELIMELEDLGFASTFDFLYIPLDKGTMSNVGYAFVNFVEPAWAEKCMAAFQNYRFKRHRKISGKIAAISVAHIQGLEANLAHYENAAVNTAKLKQRRPVIMANISQSLSGALSDDN